MPVEIPSFKQSKSMFTGSEFRFVEHLGFGAAGEDSQLLPPVVPGFVGHLFGQGHLLVLGKIEVLEDGVRHRLCPPVNILLLNAEDGGQAV